MRPEEPEALLSQARTLYDNEERLQAAKYYARAGKTFAAQSRFLEAASSFSESGKVYLTELMAEHAEHQYLLSKYCYINCREFFWALACEWLVLEISILKPNWKQIGSAYHLLAGLLDPKRTNHHEANQLLKDMAAGWLGSPTDPPYLSLAEFQQYIDFLKNGPQELTQEDSNILAVMFAHAYVIETQDMVAGMYQNTIKTMRHSQWREILATFAYTRACIGYAKTGQLEKVHGLIKDLSNIWTVLQEKWDQVTFSEYQYRFFDQIERAVDRNFQEADTYYIKKMVAYTAILKLQKSKSYYPFKAWGICGGFGASILRASITALVVPLIIFPIIYVLLGPSRLTGINASNYLFLFLDAMYLSVRAFVTFGFAEVSPAGWGKLVVSVEAITGYLIFGLWVTVIIRKMFRS